MFAATRTVFREMVASVEGVVVLSKPTEDDKTVPSVVLLARALQMTEIALRATPQTTSTWFVVAAFACRHVSVVYVQLAVVSNAFRNPSI